MTDLVGCVKEIGKCILTECIQPPVKRHFDYWWCFDSNIKGLSDEVRELDRQIYGINQKIEEARLRTEILRPGIVEWLEASTQKLAEAKKILLPDDNIPKAWNITSRYSTGKNSKKTAEEIAKLRNDGNFNRIADPAPPAAMTFPPPTSMNFQSRKGIEDQIIDSLKQSSVGVIGICGMGGVGKTTMAQRIGKRVREENLFDEVVMVTVSQTINVPKIQNEIADLLKLKFDESSMAARAYQLRTRLMDAKRKFIIFDDVWESLQFEEMGIPIESNFEKCKVLLTSRYADVGKGIKNFKVFKLKILEEDEAWLLFKDKAGDCVEGSRLLNCVAKEVVAECKGLPIALVTVGLTLRDITNIRTWKNSLSQLRKANPEDFSEVSRDVYNPLKLSYDLLDSDRERSLFLLCCLFPEDCNISVELLTWYSMGLGLFDGVENIEEARNRTHTLIGKLKSRFLLIDVEEEEEAEKGLAVKMHDVIRDVAIYIGSIEKHGFLKSLTSIENSSDGNCNWMSVDISNERMEVPVLSQFPKLRLLLLSSNEFDDISDISFEGMEGLKVLSFESISIPSLPPTLGLLKNLQTLRLVDCDCNVENISVIGELTSLKILSYCECQNIMELPAEIGRLKGLRLLELNGCPNLKRIPFGIISSLSLLEELKIRESFSEWETAGGERRNASLTELERLRNLTCLEIHISDCTLSAQEIHLSQKLVRYKLCIADYYDDEDIDYEKVMFVNLTGAVGNWIRLLARNAESLTLIGDGSNNINLAEMENLRCLNFIECSRVKKLEDTATTRLLQLEVLRIEKCESMEHVFWNEVRDNHTYGCIEFPKLKKLELHYLQNLTAFCQGLENIIVKFPNLKELWIYGLPKLNSLFPLNSETVENSCFHLFCNPKEVSFGNLQSIIIRGCYNLRCLFSVSAAAAARCLLQLEVLQIEHCELMEQLFWNDDNTDGCCIELPKLKNLSLGDLPNLTAFCQGLENIVINFPNLITLYIERLPKLNGLFNLNSGTLNNTCFHWFCNTKEVSFGNLQSIIIKECDNLRCLFSVSTAATRCLLQLEVPTLKELILINLPNLTAFCQELENIVINFPNLTKLDIAALPKLNILSPFNSETETVVGHNHNTCFHFLCNCNPKVEMGLINDLTLSTFEDNIKNIWCHQIPNNFFNNLERLDIYFMKGIRSLMSTSIAKNLVSLKFLSISECKEMIEVIEIDVENDKQVVDINCLFPNLSVLYLIDLHKLIRFWQWNHALELPLLKEIFISNCPAMETFTLGSINTTNVRNISVNYKIIEHHKDLNDVIRHMWTKRNTYETEEYWSEEDVVEDANKDENKEENKDEYDKENVNKDEDDNMNVNKDEDDNERK